MFNTIKKLPKSRSEFEDYSLAMYFRDMMCAECGTLLTAPMPTDKEENV